MIQNKTTLFKYISKALIPLVFILAGGAAWGYFKATAPAMTKAEPQRIPTQVQVVTAHEGRIATRISVMGTVVPAREVTVKARVSGEIHWVSDDFIPGGILNANDTFLSLDTSDLDIAVLKVQSALDEARADLAIEEGNQAVAREELQLLESISEESVAQTDLALRKPQLAQAQAVLASVQADLKQARLDLSHASVRAPFNAMVLSKSVDLGTYVNAQDSLATIVSTDEFWVEALVPLDRLPLIDLNPGGGSDAEIRSQSGNGTWKARVVRLAGSLNETSRMAKVILSVTDPLGLSADTSQTPLILQDYVYTDIMGKTLDQVIELPRSALQDQDTVWVYKNNELVIRTVTLAWKTDDAVYVKNGLNSGDQVVVSNISNPVSGMALMLAANTTGGER